MVSPKWNEVVRWWGRRCSHIHRSPSSRVISGRGMTRSECVRPQTKAGFQVVTGVGWDLNTVLEPPLEPDTADSLGQDWRAPCLERAVGTWSASLRSWSSLMAAVQPGSQCGSPEIRPSHPRCGVPPPQAVSVIIFGSECHHLRQHWLGAWRGPDPAVGPSVEGQEKGRGAWPCNKLLLYYQKYPIKWKFYFTKPPAK